MRYIIAGLLALGLACGVAMAQDTAPSTTIVDLSPVRDTIISIIGVVLTGIVTWVGIAIRGFFASKIDLSKTQLDEQIQQMFNEAAARSIAYAESIAGKVVPGKVDVKNEFVAVAAGYLLKMWPELTQGMSAEKIRDAIIARLPSGPLTEKADAIVEAKASAGVTAAPAQ